MKTEWNSKWFGCQNGSKAINRVVVRAVDCAVVLFVVFLFAFDMGIKESYYEVLRYVCAAILSFAVVVMTIDVICGLKKRVFNPTTVITTLVLTGADIYALWLPYGA